MSLTTIVSTISALTVIGGVAGGGYWFSENVPTKDDIKVVELKVEAQDAKTNYLYDTQMESQVKQINRLESKTSKTLDEIEQLRFLREELNTQRKMRSVK